MFGEQREIAIEVDVRRHLDDQVDAFAAGRAHDLVGVSRLAMIDDDCRRRARATAASPAIGSAAADHRQPARMRQLHARDPDAAGGAVDRARSRRAARARAGTSAR